MRECTVNRGRANRIRATAFAVAAAVLIALGQAGAGPAAAADFEVGEVQVHVDTTVSAGVSMRVEDRYCGLIHETNDNKCNPGDSGEPHQQMLNSDDGNLNYDKWDVFANTYKATVDVDLAWENFGGFFRGSFFYDPVAMYVDTARTELDRDARYRSSPMNSGVVGMGYQLLDAYLYGSFNVAGRPLDIRVGNQVLSWGESLFFAGGVSAINTVDLNRLRAPGSDLKEAFLPAPMVRVSAEIFRNFSIEGFYQLAWNYTQLDPVGSYFSTNDMVGRAAKGMFFVYDDGISDAKLEQMADYMANPSDVVISFALDDDCDTPRPPQAEVFRPTLLGATPGDLPRTPAEMFEQGFSPVAPIVAPVVPPLDPGDPPVLEPWEQAFFEGILTTLIDGGFDPRAETNTPPFYPFAIPRVKDDWAHSQGQWGIALRYFAEPIRTEFGLYYLRIHDKIPSVGFVAEPRDILVSPMLLGFGPVDLEFLANQFGFSMPLCCETVGVPIGYFREYPEDINIFGLSASTELFGVAWGFEASYSTRRPVPLDGEWVFRQVLDDAAAAGQRVKRSGFARERRLQVQLNAIATIGPGDPYLGAIVRLLHISSIAATFEVAAVKFPSLDSEVQYQAPFGKDHVDELSWGYQTLVQGFYDNPFGVPVTVIPRLGFAHAVDGNTPGLYPFVEDVKSFSAGVNVDYLGVWQFDLAYNAFFGADSANGLYDRDYVSLSVTRSF